MEKEILPELKILFQETLKRKELKLSSADILNQVPGMDSLKLIHLLFSIEKRFGVKFSTRDIVNFKLVSDIVDAIQTRKS